jgi:allophanate hydrolase
VADLLTTQPDALHPVTREIVAKAAHLTAADAFRDAYRLADLKRRLSEIWQDVDAIAVPSTPTLYTLADLDADPFTPNARLGHYTNFVNLLDLCALTIPAPARGDGRPGSLTLIAPAGRDHMLAALGRELQAAAARPLGATDWGCPAAGAAPCSGKAGPAELPIAVVGAHMSGLPLNGELTRLGARFLYRTRTAEHYRLYALSGGPPVRPGLVADADGGPIELEVWALPLSRVGPFLAGVPQPLAIGTLTLDDGNTVKGFLCEPRATAGAVDVTAYGGWRYAPAEVTGIGG